MQQLFEPNLIVPRPKLSRDQLGHVYSEVTTSEVRASIEQQHFDRNRGRAELASAKRSREGQAARLEGGQTFGVPSGCSSAQINAGVERLTPHPLYAIREEWEWFPAYGNGLRRHPMGNDQNAFYGSIFGRRIESNPLDTPRDVTISGILENQHPTQAVSTEDLVNRFTMRQRAIDETHESTSIDAHAEQMRQESLRAAQIHLAHANARPVGTHDRSRQNPHGLPKSPAPVNLYTLDTSQYLHPDFHQPYGSEEVDPDAISSHFDKLVKNDDIFHEDLASFFNLPSDHPQLPLYYEDYQNRQFDLEQSYPTVGEKFQLMKDIHEQLGAEIAAYHKNIHRISTSATSETTKERNLVKAKQRLNARLHNMGMDYFALGRIEQIKSEGEDVYSQPLYDRRSIRAVTTRPRRSARLKMSTL